MADSLTQKTIHGLKWSYISTIVTILLQLGYTAVMSRLLEPSAFGLVAMGWLFLKFGQYFSQLGIGQVLIQKQELRREDIGTAFAISILSGLLFTLLFIILSPVASTIFNEPRLEKLIYLISISFLIDGFLTVPLSLLRRNLQFKKIAIYESISCFIGFFCCGVVLAELQYGVWSLIAATLAQKIVFCVLLLWDETSQLKLKINRYGFKSFLNLGSQYSLIGFLQFLGYSVPPFYFGRFLGTYSLGLFNSSMRLSNMPIETISNSLARVLFPSFSSIQSDKVKLKKYYLSSMLFLFILIFPVSFGMFIAARQIILVVLGNKWIEAINVLKILCIVAPFSFIVFICGVLLDSLAKLKSKIIIETSYFVIISVCFYFLYQSGLLVCLYIYLVLEILKCLIYSFVVGKLLGIYAMEMAKIFYKITKHTVFVLSVIWIIKYLVQLVIMSNAISLLFQISFGFISFLFSFYLFHDEVNREMKIIYLTITENIDKNSVLFKIIDRLVLKLI